VGGLNQKLINGLMNVLHFLVIRGCVMSKKLTTTQINLLDWLNAGNFVYFCTEVSNQLGAMRFSKQPQFQTDKRAIFNLLRDGYLQVMESYLYGLRQASLTISNKGETMLKSLND